MANLKEHQAFVVPGSVKSSAVGGVEFVVRCCGEHEKSVHIQHPGKHSQEELLRIRDQHLAEVAQEHENHEAAVEFMKETVATSQFMAPRGLRQSEVSRTADSSPTWPVRNDKRSGMQQKESGDCGCGGAGE